MGPSDAINIIIILVLLVLSAFFSSAETALTTVSRHKMRALAEDKNKAAKRVLRLRENPSKMLSAILICNNVVNLSASSLSTTFAFTLCQRLGFEQNTSLAAGIATGILTILILIFGEITPKTSATINSEKMALIYSSPILMITRLLTPIIFLIDKVTHAILLLLHIDPDRADTGITEDELRSFVEVSHEEGVIESEEREMITNIVDFGDSIAKDVMIPRLDICMVALDTTYDALLALFTENKFARMPVYDETIDNIVGIVNLKDFVFYSGDKNNFQLKDLIREAHVTYEYKNVAELFMEMRKDSIPLTIVLDEYGALSGLITMEDLVEEIVGDIRDEYDADEEDEIQLVSDNEYILLGSTPLDDVSEHLHIPLESDEYDSIAGHIIKLLEHFPEPGENTEDEYGIYTVLESEKNRIDKVHVLVKPQPEEDDEF